MGFKGLGLLCPSNVPPLGYTCGLTGHTSYFAFVMNWGSIRIS